VADFWSNETKRQAEAGNALYTTGEGLKFDPPISLNWPQYEAAQTEIQLLRARLAEIEYLCDQEDERMDHFTLWALIDDIRNVARKP
jgi:hypothetical protein